MSTLILAAIGTTVLLRQTTSRIPALHSPTDDHATAD
jgi:hypothetical protein